MSVILSDIKFYAAATVAEDDVTTAIGGAIDLATKLDFTDFSGLAQLIASDAGDVTQMITLSYRDTAGTIQTEVKTLNGHVIVVYVATIERLEKAVKSATTTGDVALENQTAERSGTLPVQTGLSDDQITLDAGASAVDDFYNGMIFRATGGTGNFSIVQIIDYKGSLKLATVNRSVAGEFDNTTTFRIAKGMFFDRNPSEITKVMRDFYDTDADAPGGSDRDFYVKGFFKHTDQSGSGLTLTSCQVKEFSDPTGLNTFTLETTLNGTGTNGGGNNRQVAPSAGVGTFDDSDKTVTGGSMAPGDRIGVWMKLHRDDGAVAVNDNWIPRFQGSTV